MPHHVAAQIRRGTRSPIIAPAARRDFRPYRPWIGISARLLSCCPSGTEALRLPTVRQITGDGQVIRARLRSLVPPGQKTSLFTNPLEFAMPNSYRTVPSTKLRPAIDRRMFSTVTRAISLSASWVKNA
jgi:hypothetical protein